MEDIDSCDHCIYFGLAPEATPELISNWCWRHDISTGIGGKKCPEYINRAKYEGDYSPSYLGFLERQKDRKREQRVNLFLSGLMGILGVVIGVVLSFLF